VNNNPVTDGNGEELAERGFRELTNDEMSLVGGGVLDIFLRPGWTIDIPGSVNNWWNNLVGHW
jgi:hypothetical protein